jgi:hypothetical protein
MVTGAMKDILIYARRKLYVNGEGQRISEVKEE